MVCSTVARSTVVSSTVEHGTVIYKTVAGGGVVYNSRVRHTISSLRCIATILGAWPCLRCPYLGAHLLVGSWAGPGGAPAAACRPGTDLGREEHGREEFGREEFSREEFGREE